MEESNGGNTESAIKARTAKVRGIIWACLPFVFSLGMVHKEFGDLVFYAVVGFIVAMLLGCLIALRKC